MALDSDGEEQLLFPRAVFAGLQPLLGRGSAVFFSIPAPGMVGT